MKATKVGDRGRIVKAAKEEEGGPIFVIRRPKFKRAHRGFMNHCLGNFFPFQKRGSYLGHSAEIVLAPRLIQTIHINELGHTNG